MIWYACVVAASGILRYVTADGGEKGLWFGIVMGSVAAAGAIFFLLEKKLQATTISGLAVLLVGGWFAYESFVVKGIQNAEPRQLTILVFTIATLALLLVPTKLNRKPPEDDEE
jgi:hypothetical protein